MWCGRASQRAHGLSPRASTHRGGVLCCNMFAASCSVVVCCVATWVLSDAKTHHSLDPVSGGLDPLQVGAARHKPAAVLQNASVREPSERAKRPRKVCPHIVKKRPRSIADEGPVARLHCVNAHIRIGPRSRSLRQLHKYTLDGIVQDSKPRLVDHQNEINRARCGGFRWNDR